MVRQLATVIATVTPDRHGPVLRHLANDSDHTVRRVLAEQIRDLRGAASDDPNGELVDEVRANLATDPRHSVRRALDSGS